MRLTDPLNQRQSEVLRWIAEGCPDGTMTGYTYKTTALALQGRRLVTISKSGRSWSATLTDSGSYYLEHGSFPSSNKTPTASPASPTPSRDNAIMRSRAGANTSDDERPRRARPVQPLKLSPTEQLVADVVAADGVLEVPPGSGYDAMYHMAELVRNANRYGKTPPGKRLVHKVVRDGDSWAGTRRDLLVLEDGPAGTDAPLLPVPIPEEVGRYHTAVSALRKANRLGVASAVQTRALRILHAVAVEAERRGFTVTGHTPKAVTDHRRVPAAWHLLLTTGADTVPLRIDEETDRVEHIPTARELAEQKRNPWTGIPSHDHVPSGRLRIDIGGATQSERRSFWADRASWSLEDKLSELLREVAVRADELRLRRDAKARAGAEHQQAVEREQQRARARAAEAHRHKILEDQLGRWREVRELREYAAAIAERIAAAEADSRADDEAIAEAYQWLEWINGRADRQDPIKKLPAWPKPPELPSYELSKFMNPVPKPVELRYKPESY